jgi:tetratricopeptide (TPR) repeat protein
MKEQESADEMPFFAQAYADTVASYYDELNKDELSSEDLKVLDEAIAMILRAIAIRKNYAKYYFTLAKLYRLTGQFALAKENIRRAIEKEDSTQTDYALRINEFEILNSRIDLERDIRDEVDALTEMQAEFAEMKADIEKSKSEIEKSKFDILSFLGFFTGIISFILGSFQLGGGLEFSQRVQLMAVLLCCLMIAFSVFRLLIGQHKAKDLLLCVLVLIISFGLLITCRMLFV